MAKDEPEEEPKVSAEGKASKQEAEPISPAKWAEMEERLIAILTGADLSVLTTKAVRKQLESEFGLSLASESSKQWIKDQINAFVERQEPDGEEDDEEGEEEVEAPASRKRKAAPVPKAAKAAPKKRASAAKDGDADDLAEDPAHPRLSDEMAAVVGVQRASRFRLVKLLWIYIKQHELQDPSDKRVILCDDKLRKIFNGQQKVTAFSMSKYLGPHILPEDDDGEAKPARKAGKAAKAAKLGYTGSAELAAFCGEETNNRFAIVKKLWAHIKEHNLQSDPSDKRRIINDETLRKLFGVDEMTAFSLNKHIAKHFPAKDVE